MGTCQIDSHLGDALYRVEIRDAGEAQVAAMARELAEAGLLSDALGADLARLASKLLLQQQSEKEQEHLLDAQLRDVISRLAAGEDPDPPIDPNDPDQSGAVLAWAGELLTQHNAIRSGAGLPALSVNGNLAAAAQSYAYTLSKWGQLSHFGPDGSDPPERAVRAGYPFGPPGSVVGENLAAAQPSVSEAMDGWMNSPPHRSNILSPEYDEVGFGYAYSTGGVFRHTWVAVFGNQG